MTSSADAFWGEPLHVYSRANAIDDGTLVNVDALSPDLAKLRREHFPRLTGPSPVVLTAAVWAVVDKAVKNRRWMNDPVGVLHDVFWMSRGAVRQAAAMATANGVSGQATFRVIIRGAGRQSLWDFVAHVGPGDDGEPVVTYLMPGED
jgi:hypothetical protein